MPFLHPTQYATTLKPTHSLHNTHHPSSKRPRRPRRLHLPLHPNAFQRNRTLQVLLPTTPNRRIDPMRAKSKLPFLLLPPRIDLRGHQIAFGSIVVADRGRLVGVRARRAAVPEGFV